MKSLICNIAAILALMLAATGCSGEQEPQEIYNQEASGVVMVLNQCYYTAQLPTGDEIYFSGIDEQGQLADVTFDRSQVKAAAVYGSGFFVDQSGHIVTNRHVVDPVVSKDQARQLIAQIIEKLTDYGSALQQQLEVAYAQNQQQIAENTIIDEEGNLWELGDTNDELRAQQVQIEQRYRQVEQALMQLRQVSASNIGIVAHCEISVAYNDSHVSGPSDFEPCTVQRISQTESADLALVQLKSGKTPSKAHVFSVDGSSNNSSGIASLFAGKRNKQLSINDKVYLIGYNYGPELAVTAKGIKAQLTQGNVSQEPTPGRVMYTIPALQGSSGSPVVNAWGDLVAVNFAGIGNSQSFNFGIPVATVRQFLQGKI